VYRIGKQEVDAVARVLLSGKIFRYHKGTACSRFEKRFGDYLGIKYVRMTASGTNALAAALVGLEIGPGMEVLVPSHTFMATAVAVLAVGAIPVIVDVDESLTMDPEAMAAAIGRYTRAVIPVHMWGLPCDMKRIMQIARRHKLLVVEDACQAVGGAFEGRMLGTFGHASAFSFNYYKNITSGEGGAVVTNSSRVMKRSSCATDCGSFYWNGRDAALRPFAGNGARASEIEGAIMNAQLGRLAGMIRVMRGQKKRILRETADTLLVPIKANSPDHECGTCVAFIFPSRRQATAFGRLTGGTVVGKTGRHVYTEWDPIMNKKGAHHPALDPYKLKENRQCRMSYRKDMCKKSLDIINRSVMMGTHPDFTGRDVKKLIATIRRAAKEVVGRG